MSTEWTCDNCGGVNSISEPHCGRCGEARPDSAVAGGLSAVPEREAARSADRPVRPARLPGDSVIESENIGILGFGSSGKSVYLGMLYHVTAAATRFAPDWRANWSVDETGATERHVREISRLICGRQPSGLLDIKIDPETGEEYVDRQFPVSTTEHTRLRFSLYRKVCLNDVELRVRSMDVRGEYLRREARGYGDTEDADQRAFWDEFTPFIRESKGLIVFINLLTIQGVRDGVTDRDDRAHMTALFNQIIAAGSRPRVIVLAVAGCDMLPNDAEVESTRSAIEEWYDAALSVLRRARLPFEVCMLSSTGRSLTKKQEYARSERCRRDPRHRCVDCQELNRDRNARPEPINISGPWDVVFRHLVASHHRLAPFVVLRGLLRDLFRPWVMASVVVTALLVGYGAAQNGLRHRLDAGLRVPLWNRSPTEMASLERNARAYHALFGWQRPTTDRGYRERLDQYTVLTATRVTLNGEQDAEKKLSFAHRFVQDHPGIPESALIRTRIPRMEFDAGIRQFAVFIAAKDFEKAVMLAATLLQDARRLDRGAVMTWRVKAAELCTALFGYAASLRHLTEQPGNARLCEESNRLLAIERQIGDEMVAEYERFLQVRKELHTVFQMIQDYLSDLNRNRDLQSRLDTLPEDHVIDTMPSLPLLEDAIRKCEILSRDANGTTLARVVAAKATRLQQRREYLRKVQRIQSQLQALPSWDVKPDALTVPQFKANILAYRKVIDTTEDGELREVATVRQQALQKTYAERCMADRVVADLAVVHSGQGVTPMDTIRLIDEYLKVYPEGNYIADFNAARRTLANEANNWVRFTVEHIESAEELLGEIVLTGAFVDPHLAKINTVYRGGCSRPTPSAITVPDSGSFLWQGDKDLRLAVTINRHYYDRPPVEKLFYVKKRTALGRAAVKLNGRDIQLIVRFARETPGS